MHTVKVRMIGNSEIRLCGRMVAVSTIKTIVVSPKGQITNCYVKERKVLEEGWLINEMVTRKGQEHELQTTASTSGHTR